MLKYVLFYFELMLNFFVTVIKFIFLELIFMKSGTGDTPTRSIKCMLTSDILKSVLPLTNSKNKAFLITIQTLQNGTILFQK